MSLVLFEYKKINIMYWQQLELEILNYNVRNNTNSEFYQKKISNNKTYYTDPYQI